jgi:hypothetical protein
MRVPQPPGAAGGARGELCRARLFAVALLWHLDSGGTRYEVRSHGATRRLYTDRVFHSAWNPKTGLTGRVWDLFLPAAMARHELPARILVLGTGAGTVLLQYRRFLDPATLMGVDRDPVHIDIGRRFFGLGAAGAELHQADARDWVKHWSGVPFDLVVDDLYGHRGGEPERAVQVDREWSGQLSRLVAPGGALIVNFIAKRELAGCAMLRSAASRASFASGFRVQGPKDDNVLAVFCRKRTTPGEIRRRLGRIPALDARRLRYTMRTLW